MTVERDATGSERSTDATADGLLAAVADRLADRTAAASDPRLTVGEHVLVVDVADPEHGRLAGLAHRPPGDADGVATVLADGAADTVATVADGAAVSDLARLATAADSRLERAVGVATLNALSVPLVDWRAGDPMAALSADVDAVATVGLFRPAFRKFGGVEVRVVERDPPDSVETPPDVSVATYAPAECAAAFEGADVCFLTGSTLVYGGVDRYLAALSAAGVEAVVLVGATASNLPAPAFAAGVDVVAGALVTDVERVRERAAAGDCGTDLHDAGVEKVYVARATGDGALAGLATDGATRPASTRNTNTQQ